MSPSKNVEDICRNSFYGLASFRKFKMLSLGFVAVGGDTNSWGVNITCINFFVILHTNLINMKNYIFFLFLMLSVISCKKNDDYAVLGTTVQTAPIVGKTLSALEVAGFKQIALNVIGGNGPFIKKWGLKEVLVYMVDTSFAYMNAELDSIIKDFNALTDTNLVFRKTTDKSIATLIIYLTDKNTFLSAEPPVVGNSYLRLNSIGFLYAFWGHVEKKISNAVIFIDMARQSNNSILDNRYVLHHEMMHALGFLGHVNFPDFSSSCLFNTYNFATSYSDFDKKMIPLLYNPAIKAGMTDQELNAVIVNL